MVLCGNICFSDFYSDDLHVQGAERGERLPNVLTELQILRTPKCFPLSLQHSSTLKTSLLQKMRKSMSSLYCYLLYFNLAQVVLRNVIGDFEFANEWVLEKVISPL